MRRKFKVVVGGKEYVVEVEEIGEPGEAPAVRTVQTRKYEVKESREKQVSEAPQGSVVAPMPGKILDVKVKEGDSVKSGDVVAILEAMKMENEIVAPRDGVVKKVMVSPGDTVERGAPIIVIG